MRRCTTTIEIPKVRTPNLLHNSWTRGGQDFIEILTAPCPALFMDEELPGRPGATKTLTSCGILYPILEGSAQHIVAPAHKLHLGNGEILAFTLPGTWPGLIDDGPAN